MFDHVTIRVADRDVSRCFYDTVLAPLGYARSHTWDDYDEWLDFGVAPAGEGRPVTRRLHIGFVAASREEVDAFWRAGTEAGYASDGEPGPRPEYHESYYGGFLLDPDGNSAEAVYHGRARESGSNVDHLWLRVAELARSKRFYEAIAAALGLAARNSTSGERFYVFGGDRILALLPGAPTENVHLALAAVSNEGVEAFHRSALAAGGRDNGAPGERPQYHPGYFGAYALDPDGNNVEAVDHERA